MLDRDEHLRSMAVNKKLARALPISLALHAALIYTLGKHHWQAPVLEANNRPQVVWLSGWPATREPREALGEAPPDSDTLPPPEAPSEPQATRNEVPEPSEAVEPPEEILVADETPTPPSPAPAVEPSAPVESASADAPPSPPERRDMPDEAEPPTIDWEAERRRAVAGVAEALRRDRAFARFSLDDLVEEPVPEDPRPEESIFDAPPRPPGPSGLVPGQQKTRAGRFLVELCNAFTGGAGINLFGLAGFTACVSPGPTADYFAHLRPEYLKKRPDCSEVIVETEVGDTFTTVKCALVYKEEYLATP